MELKLKVDEILRVGEENAQTARVIAEMCESNDREVRVAIRELIASGIPIAASTAGTAGGFFLANSRDEAIAYVADLRSRIIENARRLRDFKRSARSILYPGQLPLI